MTIETLLSMSAVQRRTVPGGSYAHSFGLETYTDDERVPKRRQLDRFCVRIWKGGAGPCDAVYAVAALRAAIAGEDLDACVELDCELEAIKSSAETREASRQLGRQTLESPTP